MLASRERRVDVGVPSLPTSFEIGLGVGAMMETKSTLYSSLLNYRLVPYADGIMGAAVGEKDRFIPALAESWTVSDDGREYTFKLREGVMSVAGNELTAEDVRYTIERGWHVAGYYRWTAEVGGLESPDDVKVIDKYTVRFTIKWPSAFFLDTRVFPMNGIFDSTLLKENSTEADPWAEQFVANNDAGFGAYTIETFVPGRTLVLKAREDFWNGAPSIETVEYHIMPDAYDREARLALGDYDYVHSLPTSYLLAARDRASVRVAFGPSTSVIMLALQNKNTPFADKHLRRAVAYAIPYDQIIRQAFLGAAQPWRGLVPPPCPGYDESKWPYLTNLERAKEELAQANVPAGFKMVIMGETGSSVHTSIASRIVNALTSIGLQASTEMVDAAQYARRRSEGDYIAALENAGPMIADAGYALSHDFQTTSEGNDFGYSNPEFDVLIDEALKMPDGEERLKVLRKAQRILASDIPVVPIASPGFAVALSKRLEGVAWYPDNGLRFQDLKPDPNFDRDW